MQARVVDTGARSILVVFAVGVVAGLIAGIYVYSRLETGGGVAVNNTCSMSLLLDREYYSAALKALGNAERSVYVIMYVVKYDPREAGDPVNSLLNALRDLREKGVDVKVVVDDETYRSYRETIDYMVASGIPVRLDESASRTTHAKILIVDNSTLILGSHNWTESALTMNHEASVETNCHSLVSKALSYFDSIWGSGRSVAST
ncbi:phospholipase D-like domain-containing protein [Desulfurococcus mucosus]|uniref:Phospholipase D/Transphosphatidylase n=1 Tax=Desulfurococcus mucosus (strain ATCC 35584 / DSM 2162 / JCM 9187 / O7/1) TaxID=765177 RepID=E8R805_DESM0|nr:phospholipase D-like domain-containing protein [Desulfurococcus mucosus]ADV64631.1 phospholipase D/Transphosphatidylase [Desulfurococcus mucosus DSM 2162]